MTTFVLHPQLAKDTALIGRIGECLLLLMKDARYPWPILVPEQEGLRELHDLSDDQFSSVTQIIKQTSLRLQTLTEALKINVAALGTWCLNYIFTLSLAERTTRLGRGPCGALVPPSPTQKMS